MLNEKLKSILFLLSSVLFGCIGLLSFIIYFKFGSIFLLVNLSFVLASFALGILFLVEVFKNFKTQKIFSICELIVFLFFSYSLFALYSSEYGCYRMRKSISLNLEINLRKIAVSFETYLAQNQSFPDADNWCNSLTKSNPETTEHIFSIGQLPEIKCNFAFNRNLSNVGLEQIKDKGSVVLLVESDGLLNSSGGAELLTQSRHKDVFLSFINECEIYILFVDGQIAKYRPNVNKIALGQPYKGDARFVNFVGIEFYDWLCEGETKYLPLKWKK